MNLNMNNYSNKVLAKLYSADLLHRMKRTRHKYLNVKHFIRNEYEQCSQKSPKLYICVETLICIVFSKRNL